MKSNHLDLVKSSIIELQNNIFYAHSFFLLRDSLKKLSAPNILGEELARRNFEIMQKFSYFFALSMEASREIHLLKLAKFFDKDKEANSIYNIIGYIRANISHFTVFTETDLRDLEKQISNHRTVIKNLKIYRNQYLAHTQLNKIDIILTLEDTESITNLLIGILNRISSKLFSEEWSHKHQESEIYNQTKDILDYLYRFEVYKRQEIKDAT